MDDAERAPRDATHERPCEECLRHTVLTYTRPGSSFRSTQVIHLLPVPKGRNMDGRPDGEMSTPVSVPRRREAGRRPPHRKSDGTKPISFLTEVASYQSVNLNRSGNLDAKQTQFHGDGARLGQVGDLDEPGTCTSGISHADRPMPAGSKAAPTLRRRRDLLQNKANLLLDLNGEASRS